jgi:hypothetical protein
MGLREPMMIIGAGMKRVGKTYQTCHEIQEYITTTPARAGRKFLIYDVNNEYNDTQIRENNCSFSAKVLSIDDLPQWISQRRVEVRRILALDKDGNRLSTTAMNERLNIILFQARSCGLLLEDINKYLVGSGSVDIIGLMCTNAHADLDIYVHLQTLSKVTTTMWQNTAVVRFHRQIDRVMRYKDRLSNPELYFIAQKLVDLQYVKNKRFYCYIWNELNLIKGKFSLFDFRVACLGYLYDNPARLKEYQNRFGSGEENRKKALKLAINELSTYYGNNEN